MRICLVSTFPPSGRQLNEYGFHLAQELAGLPGIELIILADKLASYDFATNSDGEAARESELAELPGFNVVRCWTFGTLSTPLRLLHAVRKVKPDVVWFNIVFSSFATPENPFAAFGGLCAPAIVRSAGFFTHVTLHHILEHVDFEAAGVRHKKLFSIGSSLATRALLMANSVSVLLPGYRRTLMAKYSAQNVMLATHGTFSALPCRPDPSLRGNPDIRILAIGHWGTYKRLETLMSAFPSVLEHIPNARLIVAGANHHTKVGYWESIREAQPKELPIEFLGYVAEQDIANLFRGTSLLALPYDSATGSSGPAHQACEYGVPIVCADIADLREMADAEEMAVGFYQVGDAKDLARQMIDILNSPERQSQMAEQNFAAGLRMTMSSVVPGYLHWFALQLGNSGTNASDIALRELEPPTNLQTEGRPSTGTTRPRLTSFKESLHADATGHNNHPRQYGPTNKMPEETNFPLLPRGRDEPCE